MVQVGHCLASGGVDAFGQTGRVRFNVVRSLHKVRAAFSIVATAKQMHCRQNRTSASGCSPILTHLVQNAYTSDGLLAADGIVKPGPRLVGARCFVTGAKSSRWSRVLVTMDGVIA